MQIIKIILFFLFVSGFSVEKKPIGQVVAFENRVWAIGVDGLERDLAVGAPIYILDELHVGDDGKLQVRFTDGSILNLVSDTVYVIRGYRYQKLLEKDSYLADLIKGGFRSLTGAIAKKNPDGYQVKTPTATIGVRGTVIDALLTNNGLYVSCTKGLAFVMNDAGSFRVGPAESRQYLFVSSPKSTPQFFINRPPEMNVRSFVPPPGGMQIEAPKPSAPAPSAQPAPQEKIGPVGPGATEGVSKPGSGASEEFQQKPGGAGVYIQGGC